MTNESELHLYHSVPDRGQGLDHTTRAHTYDSQGVWTIEAYGHDQLTTALLQAGATERPTCHDGRLFVCDAKQLITFIAESSGLVVEFPKQRRRQLTDEQRQAKRLAMAAINSRKQGVLPSITGTLGAQISTIASRADVNGLGGAV